MKKLFLLCGIMLVLAAVCGCKPKHYFVVCDGVDSQGWKLIDTVMQEGYLISCTYQKPDQTGLYTTRCDDDGCGIK